MGEMVLTNIADALFTKTQQRVLSLLYSRPGKSFFTNEIVRWVKMGRGTVQRELDRMTSSGLLTVSQSGNQRHYQANLENPVYRELLGIVRKTFGLADVIRESLTRFDKGIEFVFIYGSIAKGEDSASSDIDLLVVSESVAYSELMAELAKAGESLGRIINPSIYSLKELKTKIRNKNAFLTRVMEQPKIWVKGNDNDIKELGKPG
jgi:predicted nucleotidyltransferase